jgi:hypothetical protein
MRCGEDQVGTTASHSRCALRKRFVCHERPHAAWPSKLNHIPWKQTRLLHPHLQIGQGMDLPLSRAQGQVQGVDGPRSFSRRCAISQHLDNHQVSTW